MPWLRTRWSGLPPAPLPQEIGELSPQPGWSPGASHPSQSGGCRGWPLSSQACNFSGSPGGELGCTGSCPELRGVSRKVTGKGSHRCGRGSATTPHRERLPTDAGHRLPGDAIFDVVEQTLGHERVFVQVHQVRRLREEGSGQRRACCTPTLGSSLAPRPPLTHHLHTHKGLQTGPTRPGPRRPQVPCVGRAIHVLDRDLRIPWPSPLPSPSPSLSPCLPVSFPFTVPLAPCGQCKWVLGEGTPLPTSLCSSSFLGTQTTFIIER